MTSGLFGCGQEEPKSRMEKRVSLHLNSMEQSAIELEHGVEEIAEAKRLNTPERMRHTVKLVKKARKALDKANDDIRSYIAFINANKADLQMEKLDRYIIIKQLLNQALIEKRQAMKVYFTSMEKWLVYSSDHYEKLMAKDARSRKSYDALLIKVNRTLKEYNMANDAYHRSVKKILDSNPDLKKKFKRRYKVMKEELGWL